MAKYIKQDCELGYIEDVTEIEYEKFNSLRHVVIGFMLGDFDEFGKYVVSEEIKKELIEMRKGIVESIDNVEICQSALKLDKHITFMVTFEGSRATLSLVEKINYGANYKLNSGTYSNINEYVLDEVITSGMVDRNVVYQRWNISSFPAEEIDIFNCDDTVLEKYFGVVRRFKYLLSSNKILLDKEAKLEEIESEYANTILDVLKNYPKLEKEVLKVVKTELQEKKDFLKITKPNFAKTFNEILNKSIEEKKSVLPEKELTEFESEQRNARKTASIKQRDEIATIIETNKENLNEKQNEDEKKGNILKIHVSEIDMGKSLLDNAKDYAKSLRKAESDCETRMLPDSTKKLGDEKQKLFDRIVELGVGAELGLINEEKKESKHVEENKTESVVNSKKVETQKSEVEKPEKKQEKKKQEKKKQEEKKQEKKSTQEEAKKNTDSEDSEINKKGSEDTGERQTYGRSALLARRLAEEAEQKAQQNIANLKAQVLSEEKFLELEAQISGDRKDKDVKKVVEEASTTNRSILSDKESVADDVIKENKEELNIL